jgi:hypothetical protein
VPGQFGHGGADFLLFWTRLDLAAFLRQECARHIHETGDRAWRFTPSEDLPLVVDGFEQVLEPADGFRGT